MKLKVGDRDYRLPKIIMKTSIRGENYSINFQDSDGYPTDGWGHLDKTQAKRMIVDLQNFVDDEFVYSLIRRYQYE